MTRISVALFAGDGVRRDGTRRRGGWTHPSGTPGWESCSARTPWARSHGVRATGATAPIRDARAARPAPRQAMTRPKRGVEGASPRGAESAVMGSAGRARAGRGRVAASRRFVRARFDQAACQVPRASGSCRGAGGDADPTHRTRQMKSPSASKQVAHFSSTAHPTRVVACSSNKYW